jgi:DNA replication licensing factor MCM7
VARIRFSEVVQTSDVDEALRLIDVSKASLVDTSSRNQRGRDYTFLTMIYNTVNELRLAYGNDELHMNVVKESVMARGFTENQLNETLRNYCDLNVWQKTENGTRLVIVRQ